MVKVQCYIYKCCSKTFKTNFVSLVDRNSNFTKELKSDSGHLISDYMGSLKNVCKSFKKFFGMKIETLILKISKVFERAEIRNTYIISTP